MVEVATTAARLQQLGCTPAQIERHIANLTRLSRKHPPSPAPGLITEEEAREIVRRLSQGSWTRYRRRGPNAKVPWAGTVVCEVLGLRFDSNKHRNHAGRVLRWLEGTERIRRGQMIARMADRCQYLVEVPQPEPACSGRIRLIRRSSTANGGANGHCLAIPLATPPRTDAEGGHRRFTASGAT